MIVKPLSCAKKGTTVHIQSIKNCCNCKLHLEEMGFIPGTPIRICYCCKKGSLVVTVRGGKVMLGEEMAKQIMVV
ncbi:FeoA family protein [Desulfofarcimen acetoxidans DSM 771]|jgi:ferrous iron transport protein A|uniref:FeoA family protein n=1 Tax=Desulfofarcimen acetoxidans (strain ATCC 49208 / DSM 771 / KCTC 5769 / VKM B-1644 / 5575) TaxID=485916 RepID=C8VWG0_DESAS|nr:ferrous iron transport protein A [Desulfofarcimen acetoxidans]ACV62512.1 FeoA family protein [Desulfofarcimen acetoxidans DSM 771]